MLLKNRLNGEMRDFGSMMTAEEQTVWLFKLRIKDFDRLIAGKQLAVSFLTITQSDVSLDTGFRWVSGVMNNMRRLFVRRGLAFFYVAALEIQPKRYRRYGVLAPHWHIAIAHSLADALPHAKRLENGHVQKERDGSVVTWDWLFENVKQKFGMYFCCDCWSRSVFDYLGKYLAKDALLKEFKEKLGRRVRVFASSRFPVEFQMSWLHKLDFGKMLMEFPDLADLYWRRERSCIVGRGKEVLEKVDIDGDVFTKIRYPRVRVIRGEWIAVPSDEQQADSTMVQCK